MEKNGLGLNCILRSFEVDNGVWVGLGRSLHDTNDDTSGRMGLMT